MIGSQIYNSQSKYAAEGAGALLEDHGGKVSVTCVNVLIDDHGKIVSECAIDGQPISDSDLPF